MHLISLAITNFGVYKGKNEFDLSTNGGNIVLFGGKNGSGKTTILNTMRLCLYGAKALGIKTTKKEYSEYIFQQIHRNKSAKVPINSASIEIEFEYGQLGTKNLYTIFRSWKKVDAKDKIEEQLLIKKNNELINDVEEEFWQAFIDDLIPLSIFDLFFFDGEKITTLMIDNLSSKALSTEIKRLLGLDLIERLKADLDIYLYQQRKQNSNIDEIRQIETLRNHKDEIKEVIKSVKQDEARIVASINLVSGQIDDLETKIHRESSGYALDREKWKIRLSQIEFEKELVTKQIQGLCSDLLPFTLVPELLLECKNQIESETEFQKWNAAKISLSPKIQHIRESLSDENFWEKTADVNNDDKQIIADEFFYLLENLLEVPEDMKSVDVLHDFSNNEKNNILNWINQSLYDLPSQSETVFNQYSSLDEEQQNVLSALRKIPSDEVLQPYVDQLNSLYQKLGNLEGQQIQLQERIHRLDNELYEANSRFVKAYESLRSEEKLELRLHLVEKTKIVLGEFLIQQTMKKLHSLEELLVARFRELSRKEDFVTKAVIDGENLDITLLDSNDNIILKEQLSAGEQQMFAISMIWALRQLSGRPFPVVIDTPLGRLDSDHRENLINQYFPHVSHQVILFSTDTEVDKSYFQELQPYISHSYHLSYDSRRGATTINEGYFWTIGELDAINKN